MNEIEDLRLLVPGSKIRVYREKSGWTECKLLKVHKKSVIYVLPSGKTSSATIASVQSMPEKIRDYSLSEYDVAQQCQSNAKTIPLSSLENLVQNNYAG
jgi:hypothetical protein